ncbi:hypothetical protein C5Y93_09715 [Blastopirellula marina]|uniref:Uncharacterized protein n=1 Tax=Blastopirellula marina TaxID=124 RepID=A0A2S8GP80_9BACT|nr:hypothetical protein C5Y93_09715 [Blastopirellula marina]
MLLASALAWSIVGYSIAILLLKWRWNLVGGTLLFTISWLPIGAIIFLIVKNVLDGKFSWSVISMREIYYAGYDMLYQFPGFGFLAGAILATFIGLWPRRNEEGKLQRWSRTLPVSRPFLIGVVAIFLSWGLFYGADWWASSTLRRLREATINKIEEEAATTEELVINEETADAHDQLLIDLLQDKDPAWEIGSEGVSRMALIWPHQSSIDDLQLLRMFVPGSKKINDVRPLVERYQDRIVTLRSEVLEPADTVQYWHPLVARLVTYDALVHLYDDDIETVVADLQLLRAMGTQLVDERIAAGTAFGWIEFDRMLVFQAVLGKYSPAPAAVYDEMQQETPGLREGFLRQLQTEMDESTVIWIDNLLAAPGDGAASHSSRLNAGIERMFWSEEIFNWREGMESDLENYFTNEAFIYMPFDRVSFPYYWGAYTLAGGGNFFEDMYHQVFISSWHFQHREMIHVAQWIEKFQEEHERYPTPTEFQQTQLMEEWPIPLDMVPLKDRKSAKVVGVLLQNSQHSNLKDQQGIYLGDSIFRLVDNVEDYEIKIKDGRGNSVWSFDPNVKNLFAPTLPDYADSMIEDPEGAMN